VGHRENVGAVVGWRVGQWRGDAMLQWSQGHPSSRGLIKGLLDRVNLGRPVFGCHRLPVVVGVDSWPSKHCLRDLTREKMRIGVDVSLEKLSIVRIPCKIRSAVVAIHQSSKRAATSTHSTTIKLIQKMCTGTRRNAHCIVWLPRVSTPLGQPWCHTMRFGEPQFGAVANRKGGVRRSSVLIWT